MTAQPTNRLLQTLPAEDLDRLLLSSEQVLMPVRTTLYESGLRPKYAYFLTDGVASIMTDSASGQPAEVGIIGREGLSGALHLLGSLPVPAKCFMQIAGSAHRLLLNDLEAVFQQSPLVHARVLEFNQLAAISAAQLAACNALHSLDQRLARWLLVVQDRMETNCFGLTHEFLAQMLAVQRPTLSIAAAQLQREGIIHYRHGQLTIVRRPELESSACECYGVARRLLQKLYRGSGHGEPNAQLRNGASTDPGHIPSAA